MGLKVSEINNQVGVKVVSVKNSSPAHEYGIMKNDIITKVGRKSIKSMLEYKEIIDEYKEGDFIMIRLNRKGNQNVLAFRIS